MQHDDSQTAKSSTGNENPYLTPSKVAEETDAEQRPRSRRFVVGFGILAFGVFSLFALRFYQVGETSKPPTDAPIDETIDFDLPLQKEVVRFSRYSRGGAHVLMGDGEVEWITDDVPVITTRETSNDTSYGLWGSLGARATDTEEPTQDLNSVVVP